jgi:signal transduction histidine kinase
MSTQAESAGSYADRRIADLTILYEVSRAMQNTLDEEKVLYTILVGVTHGRGLGFNRAFILLADPSGAELEGRLAIGPSSPEEAAVIWQELRNKHQGLAETLEQIPRSVIKRDLRVNDIVARLHISLAEEGHPLLRIMRSHQPSIAAGTLFQPHNLALDARLAGVIGTDSFAVAPLHVAGRDLGLLLADNAITRAPIEAASLRLLQIYAQAASAAIENSRLYRQLTERIAQGERTNQVLRESQQRLLHAERLSTIGKMAALLAHEIRTPLVSIGGFARRLLRATPDEDPKREELKIIVDEVRRIEFMIDEVLDYSKTAKPDLESTDINALLRSVLTTMDEPLQKASVQTVLEFDPALPAAMVDKFQLRQALINLIANALDAMPSGGTLTLTTIRDGDYLEIGIADTGIGIAQEHWNKLFAPFFTTKASGTGLGLAIVSQFIENHKGSLRFESAAGQGTSFYIRLAICPGAVLKQNGAPAVVKSDELLP